MSGPSPAHYHVTGVAGVGMSAVAQVLLGRGFRVTGSDRFLDHGVRLDVLDQLSRAGVQLVPQDGAAVDAATSGVVVSTAVEADNPEMVRARELGVPVIHRAAMLAQLARGKPLVAISGTSGKTTVTGMVGHIAEVLGLNPTVVNGGVALNWAAPDRVGNVRLGGEELWIIEADESDKSLLEFEPDWAVITNISKDHFELDEVVSLFRKFAAKARKGVICGPGVSDLLGVDAVNPPAFAPALVGGRWQFQVSGLAFQVELPGRHNAENAFVAVSFCARLGMDLRAVREALGSFRGIQRRLEIVGEARGVTVIDDYAHNPAKIAASWKAVAERARRILGFWRPHGFGPLRLMRNELAAMFANTCRAEDRVFILPVFYAGGTAAQGVSSEDLVAALRARGVNAAHAGDYDELLRLLSAEVRAGDAILGMGARDPELPRFARRMVDHLCGTS